MSGAEPAVLRTVTFGDLEAGCWGCAWADSDGLAAFGRLDSSAPVQTGAVAIDGSADAEEWTVAGPAFAGAGDELSLRLTPLGGAGASRTVPGFAQLCRVHGHAGEQSVDCLGIRAARPSLELSRLDSVRELSAWFETEEGLELIALRPARAKGHDRDTLAATVFDQTGPTEVEEPRLSTTYGRDGLVPLHAGLELWLPADDDGEPQYPRRAAGDAVRTGARLTRPGMELYATPLRWRSRGLDGAGVYLLVRGR